MTNTTIEAGEALVVPYDDCRAHKTVVRVNASECVRTSIIDDVGYQQFKNNEKNFSTFIGSQGRTHHELFLPANTPKKFYLVIENTSGITVNVGYEAIGYKRAFSWWV